MTTIRRINVSQINGNGADDTTNDEIRPQYETAFYLDGNSKLTLMMFDGVRTHRKSKVLSPGILYGSNADSGDGNNYDTIKLIPDADLKANGSDQYLIVDPTTGEPGHIHIRAGGNIDQSTADLIVGGEYNNVRVSDTNDRVTITASQIGEGVISRTWTFDNFGALTIPSVAGTYTIAESEPGLVFTSTLGFGFVANSGGNSNFITINSEGLFRTSGNLQLRSAGIRADETATLTGTIISVPLNAAGDTVDYTGGASLIEVPTNGDTTQVVAGWIITFNGGAQRTVNNRVEAGGYTSIYFDGANPGGTLYPLTIQSSNYVAPNDGNVYITPNIDNNASPTWTFANSGLTTIPGSLLSSTGSISFVANSSGDGNGYSTLQLTPDISLNTDQYLIIDPTEPDHIHIRAGGTQDDSTAQLFIGGENSYFSVGSGANPAVYARANGAQWIFDINGSLTLPSGGDIIMDSSAASTINGVTSITFADNSVQSTAFAPQPLPASPQGKAGDRPGMTAGNSSYFYYCVANYDGSSIIWHRVANDGNTGWSNP